MSSRPFFIKDPTTRFLKTINPNLPLRCTQCTAWIDAPVGEPWCHTHHTAPWLQNPPPENATPYRCEDYVYDPQAK